jgi:hypothetical protein
VTIAAIVGVIAVVVIALVFFMGGDSGPAASTPSGSSAAPSTTMLANTGVAQITVKETTAPTIPPTGRYVQVTYMGSFSGTYGTAGALTRVQDSGSRLYPIDITNSSTIARFQKSDRSAHDLTVQIYQNGKAVKYGTNSSAYGIVSIQYP